MEESISIEQLEQVILGTLDPNTVNEASSIIVEQIQDPQFIFLLLTLSKLTNNANVLLQCSIQCYHSIENHWETQTEDFQHNIFDQILDLINISNTSSYFPECISIILSYSPQFELQVSEYLINILNSANFIQLMNDNSFQFISFFKIILNTFSRFSMIQQIDLSPMLTHILENPTFFSAQIRSFCIKFLSILTYVKKKLDSEEEEEQLNLESYDACYNLFCNLPFSDTFVIYWSAFFDFTYSNVLNSEEIDQLFQKAFEIVCDTEYDSHHRILLLSIFSGNLSRFSDEFNLNLFEISFNSCTQILSENGTFPIEYLDLFEPFFDISFEFNSNLYSFVKEQIVSYQSDELINTTSVALLSLFLLNFSESIENDYDFFNSYLIECIDSDVPIIQEMSFYLLENSTLIKSESLLSKLSKSVPFLIQKVIFVITSSNISHEIRFKSINSLLSLYKIEYSCNSNRHSIYFDGLFNQLFESENLFSKENFDLFIHCKSISIFLDTTITDEQLISSYQLAQEILADSNNDDSLMKQSFFLLESVLYSNSKLNRKIDFDILFTIQIIQSILTEKVDSIDLIKSSLSFLKNTMKTYKNEATEFESYCIDLLIPFLSTIDNTSLLIQTIKVLALASLYSSNNDAANLIISNVFELIERERIFVFKESFRISQKLIKLLNPENLNHLFSISINNIYNIQDNDEIIKESLLTVHKIVDFYLIDSSSFEFDLIDEVQKLIENFIEKKLKFQIDKDSIYCYSSLISSLCDVVSSLWNFECDDNISLVDFLIEYIQSCLSKFSEEEEEGNGDVINLNDCEIENVIGCLSDAVRLKVIDDQNIMSKLLTLVNDLASFVSFSSSYFFDMKQNICFFLNQLLKVDFNLVVPFVDQFLSAWFIECSELIESESEVDDSSILIENISFLFLEIYGKTKPEFPSSQATQLLIVSIENFPPLNENCFEYTKPLLDSILSNFFSEDDISKLDFLLNSNNEVNDANLDIFRIYTSLVLSFIKLLNLDMDEVCEDRNINSQDIDKIKSIVLDIINDNEQIQSIVSQTFSDEILQNVFKEIE